MKLFFDMHTHSTYSDGKNTIEEMVEEARAKGLRAIAISDHGRSHPLYGVKKTDFKTMRETIDRLNEKYDDIDIYLSVESNITGTDGTIDIKEEEKQYCDFILAGYHYVFIPSRFQDFFTLWVRNNLANIFPWMRKKTIEANTQTYIKMMDRYDIKMITHPGDKIRIDVDQVAKKAAEKGIILEINPRHYHLDQHELKIAMKYPVQFAINSDAHSKFAIADVEKAYKIAELAEVPIERIVNCE